MPNTNNFRPGFQRPGFNRPGGFQRPGGFSPRPGYRPGGNRFHHQPQQHKFYITNLRIEAATLRVVDHEGKQIGVISKDEALKIAQEREMDLVLIAQHANPPVAKVIDLKKFIYQEEKKAKEAKKGIKKSIVKDISLSLFIAQGDLERLINKTKEFVAEGSQVRLNLTLKGREMGKKPMAMELLQKFIKQLGEINVSKEPRVEGRVVRAVVARKK